MEREIEAMRLAAKMTIASVLSEVTPKHDPLGCSTSHARWMLDEVVNHRVDGPKAAVWLGYAQCLIVKNGLASVILLRDINGSAKSEYHVDTTPIPSPLSIASWHQANGGHARKGLKAHALRALHEMVELCLAEGANASEIGVVVHDEVDKAQRRGEYGRVQRSGEEVADIDILLDVYCFYAGVNRAAEKALKHEINLLKRKWRADDEGVLWRFKDGG